MEGDESKEGWNGNELLRDKVVAEETHDAQRSAGSLMEGWSEGEDERPREGGDETRLIRTRAGGELREDSGEPSGQRKGGGG